MASSLSRLSVKQRILLVAVLPVLALIVTATAVMSERLADRRAAQHVLVKAESALYLSALVHELQRERGASAVFLASQGTRMRAELDQQRAITDKLLGELAEQAKTISASSQHEALKASVRALEAAMSALDARRRDVSGLAISPSASNAYFIETIRSIMGVVGEMSKEVDNAKAAAMLTTYLSLMQAKERAGQERATGAAGFGAGRFDGAQHRAFVSAGAAQEAFIAAFLSGASEESRAVYAKTVSGTPVNEVSRMREVALLAGPERDVSAIDGAAWYKATTARIDMMKSVEDAIAEDVVAHARHAIDRAATIMWATLAIAITVIALAGFVGWVVARGVSRPMSAIEVAMARLAEGDKTVEVPGLARTDEIGAMAKAVQVFKENAIQMEHLEAERRESEKRQADAERKRAEAERAADESRRSAQREAEEREAQARQRADKQAQESRKRAMLELADRLEQAVMGMAQSVSAASTQLQGTARSMTELAQNSESRCASLAATSTQTAQNVGKVAGAADQLSSSVTEITQRVSDSARIAGRAVDEAKSTNATVKGLTEAARRIGEVVNLINDIASQTNLLALNATIEAARAGEAGKGFAVVASEVKALANQTAKATEDISSQIAAIQSATDDAVGAIESIGSTIGEISHIATVVAGAVEEQGAATREIARNVSEAAAGTEDVSRNLAEVSQTSKQVGGAADEMLKAAAAMSNRATSLRTEVERFLGEIRAA